PAMAETISSAVTAPNTRNEHRVRTEIVNMDVVLLAADSKIKSPTLVVGAFKASLSTCDVL
ncbi:hypothetical protein, partial [Bradyrhizobium sp.]|uniref:hypothetical protein n=1 Tax=Bradyrhizobium sp. TaxID=376 RepID=UPI003C7ACB20